MMTVRFERRNPAGRVTTTMEKDFSYVYAPVLAKWLKEELVGAIHAGDTVSIRRVADEE